MTRSQLTKSLLAKVCKAKKINLDWYDSVNAWINENYTKVFILLANKEVCGGSRNFFCKKTITLSVSAIMKRYGAIDAPADEPQEWQYTTEGWEDICDLQA